MKYSKEPKAKLNIKNTILGSSNIGKSLTFTAKDIIGNTISEKEQLIGFFEPSNRPVFRTAIKFDFTGLNTYTIQHNLDILNYTGIYFFSSIFGVRNLYEFINSYDFDNNDITITPEQKKLSISATRLPSPLSTINASGYIILEYTKTNVDSGMYSNDDIISNQIDLSALGKRCLQYNSANPNDCDPQPPIELIDILLKFEKSICDLTGATPTTQLQSDWGQSDNTKVDFIKNKPTIISSIPTHTGEVTGDTNLIVDKTAITNRQQIIPNIKQSNYLLITDGSDNDKLKKIDINSLPKTVQLQSDWGQSDNTKVDFIKNKPTIPSLVQSDMAQTDSTRQSYVKNNLVLELSVFTNINTNKDLSAEPHLPNGYYTFGSNLNIQFKEGSTLKSVRDYLENGGSGANNTDEMYMIVREIKRTGDTRETKAKVFEFHTYHKGLVGTWVISYFGTNTSSFHYHGMYTNTLSAS